MWVLPSRGRPYNIERLVNCYNRTGATTPVWLRLDEDDVRLPDYQVLDLPLLWKCCVGPRVPLSEVYNEIFKDTYPWWGFIADDVVPETKFWDRELIRVAGPDGMAAPSGGHDPDGAPHFVLGHKLPISMGWLALPGLDRLYIDTVWVDIAKSKGVFRSVPDVVLRHAHFSNRGALKDETYKKHNKDRDKSIYEAWVVKYRKQGGSIP